MDLFGNRLKDLRKKSNLTQQQLASKFYLNKSSISRYENGTQVPEHDLLEKIADYFNVSIDYLLGRTDTMPPPDSKEDTPEEKISKLVKENKIRTLAAHFDGEDITDDDVEDIKNFIEFVVQKRKNKDK